MRCGVGDCRPGHRQFRPIYHRHGRSRAKIHRGRTPKEHAAERTRHPPSPAGYPRQGPYPPPRGQVRPLILGLVVGPLVGAGAVGLIWTAGEPSGANADAAAVCGIHEQCDDL
jgi:hypothetical protein